MEITSIKTAATVGHGMHLWVRVSTDAGIVGTGECVHGGKQAIAIIQYLEEKLVGRDPFAVDAIFEDMRRSHVFDGGDAGALITALTGIEIALWDLRARRWTCLSTSCWAVNFVTRFASMPIVRCRRA